MPKSKKPKIVSLFNELNFQFRKEFYIIDNKVYDSYDTIYTSGLTHLIVWDIKVDIIRSMEHDKQN